MKLVYTHEYLAFAANVQSLLEQAGVETLMKNEFSGGGRGELGMFDTWPEVWVAEEAYSKAKAIVDAISQQSDGADWFCANCGESNGSSFAACWQCQSERRIL